MTKIERNSSNNSTFEANSVDQVRLKHFPTIKGPVNMEMLQEASNIIIRLVENKHSKMKLIKSNKRKGLWARKVNYQP